MPKANKEDAYRLAALSTDCSFLLSHLIRQNTTLKKTDKEAQEILISILSLKSDGKPILKGSEIGWYSSLKAKIFNQNPYNPQNPSYFIEPTRKKGVCFTESTLAGLRAHREVFNIKYGLAFSRIKLFERGANPCLNIRESILKSKVNDKSDLYDKLYNFIPDELIGYINIINKSFDATHEREWRFLGDFEFEWNDLIFVFCPKEDFSIFSKIQKNGIPALVDLKWLDLI